VSARLLNGAIRQGVFGARVTEVLASAFGPQEDHPIVGIFMFRVAGHSRASKQASAVARRGQQGHQGRSGLPLSAGGTWYAATGCALRWALTWGEVGACRCAPLTVRVFPPSMIGQLRRPCTTRVAAPGTAGSRVISGGSSTRRGGGLRSPPMGSSARFSG